MSEDTPMTITITEERARQVVSDLVFLCRLKYGNTDASASLAMQEGEQLLADLAAQPEGMVPSGEAIIAALVVERQKPLQGPEHGAWDRGRRYGLDDAIRIARALAGFPPATIRPASGESDATAMLREAMDSDQRPKIGEGEYAYAKLHELPKMLRDQAKDVLFFDAEPHVVIDAWNIVQMAADKLEAALQPTPASSVSTEEVERAAERIIRALPEWATRNWYNNPMQETEREWARPIARAALSPTKGEEANGTFSCPICGDDKPHHHTPAVVDAYQNKRSRS
jgi:hypothetical protein